MSHYADYIRERRGWSTLEDSAGFLVYHLEGECCFVHEFYVMAEARHHGGARKLWDAVQQIAKRAGAKEMLCTVDLRALNSADALRVILSQGFKAVAAREDVLTLSRGI
jgi:GNAT superfamily N-acetyltransferase